MPVKCEGDGCDRTCRRGYFEVDGDRLCRGCRANRRDAGRSKQSDPRRRGNGGEPKIMTEAEAHEANRIRQHGLTGGRR